MKEERPSENEGNMRRLRVAVVREEFVELTGHPYQAVLLNQLYYWSQRSHDFDEFLQEERQFQDLEGVQPRHGWIFKSADDFIHETMLKVSKWTFYRRMKTLIDNEWVYVEEDNPRCKWDKTRAYRLNLGKIEHDLSLLGYRLPAVFQESYQKMAQTSKLQNAQSELHAATSTLQNATYSKITNKITSKKEVIKVEKTKKVSKETIEDDFKNEKEKEVLDLDEFINIWIENHPLDKRIGEDKSHSFEEILKTYFKGDKSRWADFCAKVKTTPRLQGENKNNWVISLEWLCEGKNIEIILKVFSPPKNVNAMSEEELLKECQAHVDKIEDSIWKEVCTELLNNYSPTFAASPSRHNRREDYKLFLQTKIWECILGNVYNKDKGTSFCILDEKTIFYLKARYSNTNYISKIEDIICKKFPYFRFVHVESLQHIKGGITYWLKEENCQDKDRFRAILKRIEALKPKNGLS